MNKADKTLRDLRGARSRKEVAVFCGISTGALAEYEDGTRIPRDEVKHMLAERYGVGIDGILCAIRETLKANGSRHGNRGTGEA